MELPATRLLPSRGYRLRLELTLLMAVLSLMVTLGVWRQSRESAVEKAQALFDLRVDELAHAVALRVADYEQLLHGARGLFAANQGIGQREWHAYVQELNIGPLHRGMETFGVFRVIGAADLEKFLAERRQDPDGANVTLKSARSQDRYVVLSFNEPATLSNALEIGRDLGAETIFDEALSRAGDSAQPAATAPFSLSGPSDDPSLGFAIYIPVYRPGMPWSTIDERRQALSLYVGGVVSIKSMIASVMAGLSRDGTDEFREGMAFSISDMTDSTRSRPFYDDNFAKMERQSSAFSKKVTIDVAGRQWVLEAMMPLPPQAARRINDASNIWTVAVALFGILVTSLTYALGMILENRGNLRRAYAQLAEREAELDRLAHSDPLTGAANRRHFFLFGAKEWGRAKRHGRALSVLMVDVDYFKAINDAHGHGVGDEALKNLVLVCNATLRDCDLLARMGGEEFAVLLAEIDLATAQTVAERLRQAAADLMVLTDDGGRMSLTVSIGVASLSPEDESLDDIVRRADRALYSAKAAGRNRVVVADQGELPLLALAARVD
jgi:diguanylate cyclase (GGDEF)-like protein